MKKYYINERQASKIITEAIANPALMDMVGNEPTNRQAYPSPIRTQVDNVGTGVGVKEEEPEPDLKSMVKSPQLKQAWHMLMDALQAVYSAAAAANNEHMAKEVTNMGKKINEIILNTNAKLNITETDPSG